MRYRVLPVLLLATACAMSTVDREPTATGATPSWGTIGATGEFAVRQRIRYRAGERSGVLEAAVEATCGTLTVVGLGHFGVPLVSVRQEGDEIAVEGLAAASWPFAPEHLLLAVHHVFLYPLEAPERGVGTREYTLGETRVEETWQGGRLWERRLMSVRDGSTLARVGYPKGWEPGRFPREVLLWNELDEYDLHIESSGWHPLPCGKDGLTAE